jgi:hypothetical protein
LNYLRIERERERELISDLRQGENGSEFARPDEALKIFLISDKWLSSASIRMGHGQKQNARAPPGYSDELSLSGP